jgi:hypothetical protein
VQKGSKKGVSRKNWPQVVTLRGEKNVMSLHLDLEVMEDIWIITKGGFAYLTKLRKKKTLLINNIFFLQFYGVSS